MLCIKVMAPGQPMEGNEPIADPGAVAKEQPTSVPLPQNGDSSVKPKRESTPDVQKSANNAASSTSLATTADNISIRFEITFACFLTTTYNWAVLSNSGRSERTPSLDHATLVNPLLAPKLSLERDSSIRRRNKGG